LSLRSQRDPANEASHDQAGTRGDWYQTISHAVPPLRSERFQPVYNLIAIGYTRKKHANYKASYKALQIERTGGTP
jgi:hypothetical protein